MKLEAVDGAPPRLEVASEVGRVIFEFTLPLRSRHYVNLRDAASTVSAERIIVPHYNCSVCALFSLFTTKHAISVGSVVKVSRNCRD